MSGKHRLARTKQCDKCPWKIATDPYDIPNGYSEEQHRALETTIAQPGMMSFGSMPMMSCHEHPPGKEVPCLGWLFNQIGPGNNVGLRLWAMRCENLGEAVLDGEQHETFEDTLP